LVVHVFSTDPVRNARDDRSVPTVAIVGAGLAGTLVAANLLRAAISPLRITLVERGERFGPGVAYGTTDDRHLLNVPAARMSAFCNAPLHFVSWHRREIGPLYTDSYVPRHVYGRYLEVLLDDEERWGSAGWVERVRDEVRAVRSRPLELELELAGGRSLIADSVVLATGDLAGGTVPGVSPGPGIVTDPWRPGALSCLAEGGTTALIGTGLTAVDVALTAGAVPGARVVAVSRRGLLPRASLPGLRRAVAPPDAPLAGLTLAELEAKLRHHTRARESEGANWRDVVDGIRTDVPRLWGLLPASERRRFLQTTRRSWEVHRHRMAPATARALQALRAAGRFEVRAGRVLGTRHRAGKVDLEFATPGTAQRERLAADRIVVCTGPSSDVRATAGPPVADLLEHGLAHEDELGLGVRSGGRGELHDGRIRLIGALRRGDLWESTAAREIRMQAEAVAVDVCRDLGADLGRPDEQPALRPPFSG
jgi:uncharacterized NAD(P)/FAD-binding protein YdhS